VAVTPCSVVGNYALVRTDVSEERIASIIKATRIGEVGTLAVARNIVFLRRVFRLLVTANVVPSSLILVTLMMVVICSSEATVTKRSTRRNNPEDGILQSHRRENLTSYTS
jgi:hypothetical protein